MLVADLFHPLGDQIERIVPSRLLELAPSLRPLTYTGVVQTVLTVDTISTLR